MKFFQKVILVGVFLLGPAVAFGGEEYLGHFHFFIDDKAKVFLNGEEIHSGELGASKTEELTIKDDDVVSVILENTGDPKLFVMYFLTSDRKKLLEFSAKDFRVATDLSEPVSDAGVFEELRLPAEKIKRPDWAVSSLVREKSEGVWGNADVCQLVTRIVPFMGKSYWE